MSFVFVLDSDKRPCNPVHQGEARRLLTQQKAAVYRTYPFTIILKAATPEVTPAPLRVKIDPGSTTTGLAVVNDVTGQVVWAAELTHHGHDIREKLISRSAQRHGRRARHTRYRPARFLNRTRPQGWLPPSLVSRIQNVMTWVQRLQRLAPIAAISYELVRFDTQLMQDAEITGVQYQQLQATGVPIEVGTGGRTKWNRTQRSLAKTHWLDAACVGASTPEQLRIQGIIPLSITATGRQRRQMCLMDRYGFPRTKGKAKSTVQGFRSGDMAKAIITTGTKIGTYVGRVAIRETGSFNITTTTGTIQGLNVKYFTPIQRTDGYTYQQHTQKARSA